MIRLTRPRIVRADCKSGRFTVRGVGHDGRRIQRTFRYPHATEQEAKREFLKELIEQTPDTIL